MRLLLAFVCAATVLVLPGCAVHSSESPDRPSGRVGGGDQAAPRTEGSRLGVSWKTILGRPFTIIRILPGSKAYEAGLRVGDQILTTNGLEIHDPAAIAQYFSIPPGRRVVVTYRRGGMEGRAVVTTIPLAPWQR